jgi:hypothetical protein
MTFTPTATEIIIDNRQLAIDNIVIIPNPYNPYKGDRDLQINFEITQKCSIIKVRIYTTGYRLIKQITLTDNFNTGINSIEIKSRYINNLANGVYYLVVVGRNSKGEEVSSKPAMLIILK